MIIPGSVGRTSDADHAKSDEGRAEFHSLGLLFIMLMRKIIAIILKPSQAVSLHVFTFVNKLIHSQ